jgi:hypothetical protein
MRWEMAESCDMASDTSDLRRRHDLETAAKALEFVPMRTPRP